MDLRAKAQAINSFQNEDESKPKNKKKLLRIVPGTSRSPKAAKFIRTWLLLCPKLPKDVGQDAMFCCFYGFVLNAINLEDNRSLWNVLCRDFARRNKFRMVN